MCENLKIAAAVILPNCQSLIHRDNEVYEKSMAEWYPRLKFPVCKPPKAILGPVWKGLYCSMGYASYVAYKSGGGFHGAARIPLALYGTQLALNWAWSPIFFKHKELGWATVDMAAVLGVASATAYGFYKIDPLAGYLMLPYLAWLAFSLKVNYQVWQLNQKSD